MRDLTNDILELIRRTSSSLPNVVEERLQASSELHKLAARYEALASPKRPSRAHG